MRWPLLHFKTLICCALLCATSILHAQNLSVSTTPAAANDTIFICVNSPASITYNASYSGTGIVINGTFAGGTPGSSVISGSQSVSYSAAGTYQTTIVADSSGTTLETRTLWVVAETTVPASFSTIQDTLCSNDPLYNFTQGSPAGGVYSGTGVTGGQSFDPSVGAGTYTITYTYTTRGGCSSSATQTITVLPAPDAFLFEPNNSFSNCNNTDTSTTDFTIEVYDASSGTIVSYHIDWGDGTAPYSSSVAPAGVFHTYTSQTIFNLVYTVTHANGCTDSETIQVINLRNPPSLQFQSPGNTIGCAPYTIAFPVDKTGHTDTNSVYYIDYGDGSDTIINWPPPDTIFHTYDSSSCPLPGNQYTISVEVRNGCNPTPSSVGGIIVAESPDPDFIADVDFVGCVNQPVTIENTSEPGFNLLCDRQARYIWDYGDGSPRVTQISFGDPPDPPAHTYTSTGIYNIELIIEPIGATPCGADSITIPICIQDVPLVNFELDDDTICSGETITFSYLENMIPLCDTTDLIWTITPATGFTLVGGSNLDSTVTYRFHRSGNYRMLITASNECGQDTMSLPFVVQGLPVFQLPADTAICGAAVIDFKDPALAFSIEDSLSEINSYQWAITPATGWAFLNGTTADTALPTIDFQQVNTYLLVLTITNNCGSTSDSMLVDITERPVLDTISDTLICYGNGAGFRASATLGLPPYTFSWGIQGQGIVATGDTVFFANLTTDTLVYVLVSDSLNCTDSTSFNITVTPELIVDAGPDQDLCYTDSTSLNAVVTGGSGSYQVLWTPTVGLSDSTILNPSRIALDSSVTYYLQVTDSLGCTFTDSVQINVYPLVNLDIGSDTTVCLNSGSFSFTPTPSGGTWSGNGVSPAGLFDPVTAGLGNHVLNYLYVDGNGCVYQDSLTVSVLLQPSVSLEILSDTSGCSPFQLIISDTSGVSGDWYFNNTLVSLNASDTILLFNNSNQTDSIIRVKRIGSSGVGCSDSIVREVIIFPKPLADFSVGTICPGDSVQAVNNSISKAGATTYLWRGDVYISDTTAAQPTFYFPDNQSGVDSTYTIELITTSVDGCTDTISSSILVESRPRANFSLPQAGCGPQLVNPQDSSVGNSLVYQWSIAPTGTAVLSNAGTATPSISFPAVTGDSAVYQISLSVTDPRGCADSITIPFTVYPTPVAAFSFAPGDSCGPLQLTFQNNSLSGQTGIGRDSLSYQWDFGNGQTSTDSVPTMTFTNTGLVDSSYIISLIVTNPFGCADTISDTVVVHPDPNANFTANTTIGCAPFTIYGDSINIVNYPQDSTSYQWTIVDPQTGAVLNTFNTIGGWQYLLNNFDDSVIVRLIATSSFGCQADTAEMTFRTTEDPSPFFVLSSYDGCGDTLVVQVDSVSGGVGIQYSWYVDNVLSSNAAMPSFDLINTGTTDLTYIIRLDVQVGNLGCFNTTQDTVTVWSRPTALWSADSVCHNDSTSFTNSTTTSDSISIWQWDFGDGGTSSLANPIYRYANPGTYFVTLTAQDRRGCTDVYTDSVVVYTLPVADFTSTGDSCGTDTACLGMPHQFTDLSTLGAGGGSIVSWEWDFDNDGVVDDTSPNPVFTYTAIGTYSAQLRTASEFGCSDTIVRSILVREPPVSRFTKSQDPSCGPVSVTFQDSSSGSIDEVLWEVYGLNRLSGAPTLITSSTLAGNYTPPDFVNVGEADTTYLIRFTVSNCCGTSVFEDSIVLKPFPVAGFASNKDSLCSNSPNFLLSGFVLGNPDSVVVDFGDGTDTTVFPANTSTNPYQWPRLSHSYPANDSIVTYHSVTVTAYNECDDSTFTDSVAIEPKRIDAFFTLDTLQTCINNTIEFYDQSFAGVDSVKWCFDYDPVTGACNTPISIGDTVSHLYTVTGNYFVANFVDGACDRDTFYLQVTIRDAPLAGFSIGGGLSACPGDSIQFTNQSTVDSSLTPFYIWDFGDGNTSFAASPMHAYATDGTYPVCLTVSYGNGCGNTICDTVVVVDRPSVNFSAIDTCLNTQPIQFYDSTTVTSGNIVGTIWKFGDGNTAIQNDPQHTYAAAGAYTVTLIKTSSNGCIDSIQKLVNIFPIPDLAFDMTRISGDSCSGPQRFQFTNNSTGAHGFSWDFKSVSEPGVNVSSNNNPIFEYDTPGFYEVKLVASNGFGCDDSITRTVYVRPNPQVAFTISPAVGCEPLTVAFDDATTFAAGFTDTIVDWYWDFGDGNTANGSGSVVHVYAQAGTYSPKLVVQTIGGCRDSVTYTNQVLVHPTPVAAFNYQKQDARTYQFFASIAAGQTDLSFHWDFGNGDTSNLRNPIYEYEIGAFDTTTVFWVCLTVSNSFGCDSTLCRRLKIEDVYNLWVPNAFAPDLSGVGDGNVFLPKGHSLVRYTLKVYDEWGNLVFKTSETDEFGIPSQGWDGTNWETGRDQRTKLPMGAYVWKVEEAEFKDGTRWEGKEYDNGKPKRYGTVTLIR